MRIISGEFRGRRLTPPRGTETRPMLDRVREALFSTLGALVDEARVLDLFAGTGSLGLEALSRGARDVTFIEKSRAALANLDTNIEGLAVAERVNVLAGDALDPELWRAAFEGERVDLAFLDPPYPMLREIRARRLLLERVEELAADWLAPGGALVLHTHPRDLAREDAPGLDLERRLYGRTALWYHWKPVPEDVQELDAREDGAQEGGTQEGGAR